MALVDLIFVIFVLYLLYKLVFNLILPVSKAASSVRDHVRNTQANGTMQQPHESSFQSQSNKAKKGSAASTDIEDIDFEEIK